MNKGTLPNISHLAELGTFDKLITHKYTQTRLVWPIIYSGYSPAHNGISIDMVSNYAGLQITPDMRTVPAIWEDVASKGGWSMVITPYESTPAERENHVMEISDAITHSPNWEDCPEEAYSSNLVKDWSQLRLGWGEYNPWVTHSLEYVLSPSGFNAPFLSKWKDRHQSALAALKGMDEQLSLEILGLPMLAANSVLLNCDLTVIYFEGTDIFQHMYNSGMPLSVNNMGNTKIKTEMRLYDAAVGKMMDSAPPGSYFCVVSDHGFDMVPADHVTFQYQAYWEQTADEVLKKATDATINNKRLFADVTFSDSSLNATLNGELTFREKKSAINFLRQEPNLFPVGLGFAEDHGSSINNDAPNKYVEDATPPVGIFLLSGPGTKENKRLGLITIYDVTPTLLYAMGLEVAADMDGGPTLSIFNSGWVGKHQVRLVDHLPQRRTAQTKALQDNSARLLELQGLGYTDIK